MKPDNIVDILTHLGGAACALDMLFAGSAENPTGINDAEKYFKKRDLNTLNKAADTIDRLIQEFDGKKQQSIPCESGRYILNSDGYEKEVEAVFDDSGNLTSLIDDEGNSWLQWAKDYGVLDPKRENYYLESIK